MHIQRLAQNPWRKPLATISTKRCIDTDRVYQPGFAVYITLGRLENTSSMDTEQKIERLKQYQAAVQRWQEKRNPESRSFINQHTLWVRRELIEARCFHTFTVGPPPAIGGLIMRNVDPLTAIFNPPYGEPMAPFISDMIDRAIGVLLEPPPEQDPQKPSLKVDADVRDGYAFVAMPIDPQSPELEDVLDAIKESANRCGIHAERVDEPQSNERITDRILESIRKAEFVIVDLTNSRPNVFYEAGYAQGLGKTPIFIAREETKLEFDLKDYPVIFFRNMKTLKDALETRLRGLRKAA
jgi:hypothetical protein